MTRQKVGKIFETRKPFRGGVAQLGEHLPCKQGVMGSIPIISTNFKAEPRSGSGLKFVEADGSRETSLDLQFNRERADGSERPTESERERFVAQVARARA